MKKKGVSLILAIAILGSFCVPVSAETVLLSPQNLYVDGDAVPCEKYNIDGSNYFKLRDLAMALSGTENQFEVGFSDDIVEITTGQPYTAVGGEWKAAEDRSASAQPSAQTITIDGKTYEGFTVYNIGGNNFFRLRELGDALGFAVDYDPMSNSAVVTSIGNTPVFPDPGLWDTEEINSWSKWFTNHVNGYRMQIQSDMEVDMSHSGVRTVLRNRDCTIEIYDQYLSGVSFASYISYGNRFVSDGAVYTKLSSGTESVAGHNAYVLEWCRPALSRIDNDKRYYAGVDVELSNNRVLSFLFKSARPFDQASGKYYRNVLNTLQFVPQTAAAVDLRTETVTNPHWNDETRAYYESHFGPDAGLTWGLYEWGIPENYDTHFRGVEHAVDHKFEILLKYSNLNRDLTPVEAALKNAAAEGRTLELTLQTSVEPLGGNMMLNVLDGKYDYYLGMYARAVAKNGKPVLFRLCNEMNGDWCIYSAAVNSKDAELYVEFYRYIYRIFEKNGALANTIWVWNPNERSYPDFGWNHALCYYPGDEYVDVVGLTGYNNGTYYADVGERWRSFYEIYDGLYRQYDAWFSQPMMITEFACSSYGGDKAAWVEHMLSQIGNYPGIKAAVWWDGCDWDEQGNIARPYFIDDNAGVLRHFRNYFATGTP